MTNQQQAVIVHIKLSDDEFGDGPERMAAYEVEDRLLEGIAAGVGEVDGHEFGGGYAKIFLYGTSAETLFVVVLPILAASNLRHGSFVTKRYGPPGATEERITGPFQSK